MPERNVSQATRVSLFEVVFPSQVNHLGTLFGGIALQWMDRAAWICATRFTRKTMVTIASDEIVFKQPVRQGAMVELIASVAQVGKTSVRIEVELYCEEPLSGERMLATHGQFTMVAVDKEGQKVAVGS
jgi:acyl-CoA hydrolase